MKALSKNAQTICAKRYYLPGETTKDMWRRIAKAVSQAELLYGKAEENKETIRQETENKFFEILSELQFIPNSPCIHAAGTDNGMLSGCFVLPITDSMKGIFGALSAAAKVQQMGGGTGFDFSPIRPKGSAVGGRKGAAGGPLSFMEIFDTSADVVTQTGLRKGANMALLRVDHPEILAFIKAKRYHDRLNNFNLSVAITDKFMKALQDDTTYALYNPRNSKEEVGRLSAKEVWDLMTQLAWEAGDPGVVFIDTVNKHNPTPKLGRITATNPCGRVGPTLNISLIARSRRGN